MERPRRDDVLELEVHDLAFGGAGVARHDGYVVFCRDTAPGDRVRARVTKARRRFAEAELVEVLVPGPDRVPVPCPYVPRCGGCRLQHVDYDVALAAKRAQVAEHLARIGHLEGIEVREPDPALERFGYRNKMEYSAAPGPGGGARAWGSTCAGAGTRSSTSPRACWPSDLGNAVREEVRRWAVGRGPGALRPARPGRNPAPRPGARGGRDRPGAGDAWSRRPAPRRRWTGWRSP